MFGNRAVRQRTKPILVDECPDECPAHDVQSGIRDFSSLTKEAGRQLHLLPLSLLPAHEFPMGTDLMVFVALLAFERAMPRYCSRSRSSSASVRSAPRASDDSSWTTHLVCSLPLR